MSTYELEDKLLKRLGDFLWILGFLGISFLLLSPLTNDYYVAVNDAHPYLMGLLKFAVLATMGEMLAGRLADGLWKEQRGVMAKMMVWGVIGIIITFMFKLFPYGIQAMIDHGYLFGGEGFIGRLLFAIYNSIVANFAFGPIFMGVHRISDTLIDHWAEGRSIHLSEAIEAISWPSFFRVVVGKMIPFFWFPAHTITFMLPGEYRILFAAYLSIVLGVFMAIAKKKGSVS